MTDKPETLTWYTYNCILWFLGNNGNEHNIMKTNS